MVGSVAGKTSRPSRLSLGAVLLVTCCVVVAGHGPAGADSGTWQPVYNSDFPDPSVMVYQGTEYAYSTNSGFINTPWATSSDSTQWRSGGSDAFPALPPWSTAGATWAPSVAPNALGQFVMWYTVHDAATGTQCISRAVASSPSGPFSDTNAAPLICQASLGSIDPDIFTAPNGQSDLYWKSDGNSVGETSVLWGAPLDASLNLAGPGTVMLTSDQAWQETIIEAPDMAFINKSYYLFYSSNGYNTSFDAIGYASCAGPLGPCQDSPYNPVLDSGVGMSGPGGPSIFQAPNGQLLMAFDAWPGAVGYANGGYRAMYMASISFGPGGNPVFSPDNPKVGSVPIRIYGQDAIGTSIAVSQAEFPSKGSAKAVILARSDYFSDALAGGPLAAKLDGPLLITPGVAETSNLDPRVQAEIQRVLPTGGTVYLLGGSLALSPDIDSALQALGYVPQRVAGPNEYATAVDIAEALGNPTRIFEATGRSFQDALSAVPAAIATGGAILLTDGTSQAPETAFYLGAFPGDSRYAIGGPFAAYGADPGATPVFGPDLYGTSAAVAATFFPNATVYGAATGVNYPDALAGGVYMATGGRLGPVLLVNTNAPLPGPIIGYLNTLAVDTPGYVFGGPLAVGDDVLSTLQAAVG